MDEIVFDFEGDGLHPTKIHVFSYSINNGEVKSTNDYDEIKKFIIDNSESSYFIGHNIIRFDIPHLCRLLELDTTVFKHIVDTLPLSWYLHPQMPRHGIEAWGDEYGVKKPYIEDWHGLTYEEYSHRCERDVEITNLVWKGFKNRLSLIYRDLEKSLKLINYLNFKMQCARLQEESKWKLDIDLVKSNLEKLYKEKEEKENDLKQAMPKVPIIVQRHKPKVMYKKDGELSSHGKKWIDLLTNNNIPLDYDGEVDVIVGYDEPNPSSHPQIKDWLFSLGWVPTTFKQNKKKEEVPQISPDDPDKKGELCESVLELTEKSPAIHSLAGFFVINHRIGLLEGFLENVDEEGYLIAEVAGLTNTLRFKHSTIVNLPSVNKPYGEYIRPCLIAPTDEYELCGSDMSSLEDRTKQHYIFKYDPDYVNEMNIEGWDPHLDIAVLGGMMTKEEVDEYKVKPTKELKNKRHGAKTTNYSLHGEYKIQ